MQHKLLIFLTLCSLPPPTFLCISLIPLLSVQQHTVFLDVQGEFLSSVVCMLCFLICFLMLCRYLYTLYYEDRYLPFGLGLLDNVTFLFCSYFQHFIRNLLSSFEQPLMHLQSPFLSHPSHAAKLLPTQFTPSVLLNTSYLLLSLPLSLSA